MPNLSDQDRFTYARAEALYVSAYSPAVMVEECLKLDIEALYLKQDHAVGVRLTSTHARDAKRYARFPWPQGFRQISIDDR